MTSETRVDVLAVLADIWHRGLCSENVNDFEAAGLAVAKLIDAARKVWDSGVALDGAAWDDFGAALSRIAGEA